MILLGPPGGGKTTQAKFISRNYGIPSISMAGLLKKQFGGKVAGSKRAKKQHAATIESGDLVSDEMANDLVGNRVAQRDALNGFILDGYPRTAGQAKFLDRLLSERGLPAPTVLHLEVPDPVALERMKERGRADDQPEIMQRRLEEYHAEVKAVLDWYGEGSLHRIDGTLVPKSVSSEIEKVLGNTR